MKAGNFDMFFNICWGCPMILSHETQCAPTATMLRSWVLEG